MIATKHTATVTLRGDRDFLIEREFNAPAHLVWRAITEPDLVRRWWCGERGEVTSAEIDLRVGGTWRYVMVACEGFEVAFHGEYRELAEAERIVTTEVYEGAPDAAALNTITLTETDGRTHMSVLVEHELPAHRDAHINSGMEGGMQEAYDRLEEIAIGLE
jgi:uncharacterized protein YndB with AHSA1/START domain